MRYATVCSGIESASQAWHTLGWSPQFFSEVDPFPSAVLAERWPGVPNLGDMTAIDGSAWRGKVDLLCAGTPCQAFSVAGARRSLDDARGNLTLRFARLCDEIGPEWIVWENVPGVLNTRDNAFGCLLAALAGEDEEVRPPGKRWSNAGCVFGPARTIAWRVLDAQYFGVAQRRSRVFLVASAGNGCGAIPVLFEREGLRRDTAPSRAAGQDAAGPLDARAAGGGFPGTDGACDGHVVTAYANAGYFGAMRHATAADPLRATGGDTGNGGEALVVTVGGSVTHTLGTANNGKGCGEDGTGRGVPIVAFGGNRTGGPLDVATAVNAHGGPHGRLDFESETFVVGFNARQDPDNWPERTGPLDTDAGSQAVVYDPNQVTCPTNRSDPQPGGPCHTLPAKPAAPLLATIAFSCKDSGHDAAVDLAPTLRAMHETDGNANGGGQVTVAFQDRFRGDDGRGYDRPPPVSVEQIGTLETVKPWHVAAGPVVRRLTPTECERLMGFPDGYTAVARRGAPAKDGPRYRALGNSKAVPVVRWIGQRIAELHAMLS